MLQEGVEVTGRYSNRHFVQLASRLLDIAIHDGNLEHLSTSR